MSIGMKKGNKYPNQISEHTDEEKRRNGVCYMKSLFLNVWGMEIEEQYPENPTGRRMVEVWKDEGKEDSEGRREWKRRWREVGDIMNEEDVMETCIMHLCVPDQKDMEYGLVVQSECSYNALTVSLNGISDRKCNYHFPRLSHFFIRLSLLFLFIQVTSFSQIRDYAWIYHKPTGNRIC